MRRAALPDPARTAPLFAALGDETRLRIVTRLCREGPLSIAQLTTGTDVTRQAVTKHLLALENAGLLEGSRSGRERRWEIRARRLAEATRYLEAISTQWDSAIERLRSFVEHH
jgi:DNA-binding transcriptional ArsR family regulator